MADLAKRSGTLDEHEQHNMEHQRSISPHTKPAPYLPSAGSYLTPPTDVVHSFSAEQVNDTPSKQSPWAVRLPPFQHHTPPTSPEFQTLPRLSTATGFSSHDPTLFPDEPVQRPASQAPLFPQEELRCTPSPKPKPVAIEPSPSRTFAEIVGVRSPADALAYWNDRMAELSDIKRAAKGCGRNLPRPRKTVSQIRRDRFDQQLVNKISRHAGVTKPLQKPKATARPKAAVHTSPAPTATILPPRKQRATPKARSYSDSVDGAFASAQSSSKHRRAPPSKKTEGDNRSWKELPDYAPPTSSLDANTKPLKVSWTGNSVDLSNDPDKDHMHPQELVIAAALRLSCDQYLTNKRKIFQGRLQALKDDKNFTKTRAQGACSIDVNKASQLWEAFDKAGWFEKKWFEQYL